MLVDLAAEDRAVRAAGQPMIEALGAPGPVQPVLLAAAARVQDAPVIAVTATEQEAEELARKMLCLLPPEKVSIFPGWETLPH
jgi:transcription-repair coupling factor (superfamily II helicase)